MRLTLGQERWTVGDWAPVVAVAALSQLGIGLEQPWMGSDLGLTVTSAGLALPLLCRRRWPLGAALAVGVALPVQVALGGSLGFGSACAALFAAFAVARHSRPGHRAVVGGVALVLGVLGATLGELAKSPSEVLFPLFYIGAAGSLGRVVRFLVSQTEDLRRLNEALQRERESARLLAVATERVRLARELHDGVAHTMMMMVIQAEAAQQSLDADPAAADRSLTRIAEAGRGGLSDLRSLVRVLRSRDDSAPAPGLADVPALAAVLADAGIAVHVDEVGAPGDVPPEIGAELFRVVQEALTNVVKHSDAREVTVRLAADGRSVSVSVIDLGPRGAATEPAGGHGLLGMTERVEALGGTVSAGPVEHGFEVTARVPSGGIALPRAEAGATPSERGRAS